MSKNQNCNKFVLYEYTEPATIFEKIFGKISTTISNFEGLDAGNHKIYKFIKYNKFETEITEVPKEARKKKISIDIINKYYCGNKSTLTEDKNLLSKYSKDKSYFILDNGGHPFCVFVNSKYVDVFRIPKNMVIDDDDYDKINKYHYSEKIASFNPKTTFIGKSPKNKMTRFSHGYGNRFDGNSILLELSTNNYVFIGWEIYSFKSLSKIIKFVSPIGGSSVVYPYGIDKNNNFYLLTADVILQDFKFSKNYDEPYGFYYDNFESKKKTTGLKNPLKIKKKMIQKRLI
jgi:hypothetical protein